MACSDVISGALVILFGLLSVSRRCGWAQWANTFVGIWLLCAPLVFWTPSPAAYANATLVGALVIAFAVLVAADAGNEQSRDDGQGRYSGWLGILSIDVDAARACQALGALVVVIAATVTLKFLL